MSVQANDQNMIEPTRGNILSDDAEALLSTVNCVGVMGKGIALQFMTFSSAVESDSGQKP